MFLRLLRRLASAEALALVLLLIALQAFAYGIASSLRNTETASFFGVCLLAALIAYGLSKRHLSGIHASVGMIALGFFGVWILGARLATPLLDLGKASLSVVPQIFPALRSEDAIDATRIAEQWLIVAQASKTLTLRIQTWLLSLSQNATVNDALLRNMAWVLILWLVSAWTGWFAGRRNALAALLPSIILLAVVTSYSEYRIETLWMMMFILLLLMGVWNYRNHIREWERDQVDYSDSIRYDVSQAVVFLSLAIGAIALITPSISWQAIRDLLREDGKNELAETLGVQQQPPVPHSAPAQKPSLPRDHLLGGGAALSQQIVMTIHTGELAPSTDSTLGSYAPRHYWRSTTYDTYVGEGWITSSALQQTYQANTPLIPGLLNGYRVLHLEVEMLEPQGKLFWSGVLLSADIPVTASWRLKPQSNPFADQTALLQVDMFAASTKERAYTVESYTPLVTVEELRAVSTDYPEYIRERYLQLPNSIPHRVLELAREITENKKNPYDKAKAIEVFLRTYPYDLEVPGPPAGNDVADFFLFDLKKGYCDYYATAMVVLARASGVPARFVSGYAPGSYDATNAEYVVREAHAHSWAEVYFPEIGWIEFEPTASQPVIELPASKDGLSNSQPSDNSMRDLLNRYRRREAIFWLSPIALLLLGFVLYFVLIEHWLYVRLAPAIAIEKIYRSLYRLGRPLAGERVKAETAYEFMQRVVHKLEEIKDRSRMTNYFSLAQQDVELLTDMYQDTLFAHRSTGKDDVRTAIDVWKHLRLRLWLARISIVIDHALKNIYRRAGDSSVTKEDTLVT